tara:strand:+ start:1538 stop:1861 length:324 start_codon:yes stop_codon:yes gene_type:complete
MKNFEKKETNLNQLIKKLGKLNTSYSQFSLDNKSIERERDIIKSEKDGLEKKNQEILREHKYLNERIKKLEHELKLKKELEKKFNQDINDLNQETQSLVEEIEKWQM